MISVYNPPPENSRMNTYIVELDNLDGDRALVRFKAESPVEARKEAEHVYRTSKVVGVYIRLA